MEEDDQLTPHHTPRQCAADGEWVTHQRGRAAGERRRLVREAELPHDRQLIEVDALARQSVAFEDEVRTHATPKRAARGRQRTQWSQMRPEQVELDDDRVVGVVQRDELVALVGERARLSAK